MKTETPKIADAGLRERLQLFQKTSVGKNKKPGLSLTELGDRFNYSPTSISRYLSGTYNGNLDRLELVLRNGLSQAMEREQKLSGVFDTPAGEKIRRTCYTLIQQGWIGALYGDAGIGKTLGTCPYLFENLGAVFGTMVYATTGVGSLTNLIYRQVRNEGDAEYYKDSEAKWDYLVRVFKGSARILILDQAHLLRHGGRQFICDLNDACGVAILLIGNPSMFADWRKQAQQARRLKICERISLSNATRTENEAQVKADIQRLSSQMLDAHFPEGREELLRDIVRIANGDGALGSVQTTLALTARIYKADPALGVRGAFDAAERQQVRNLGAEVLNQ